MIKKHIHRFPYDPSNRREWAVLRKKLQGDGTPDIFRVGGSDIGKITGTDEYTADITFFYHSCGWQRFEKDTNLLMYRGSKIESFIYDNYYQWFDPKYPLPEIMIQNEADDKLIRKATRTYAMLWNPRYEHLFGNIDYSINKKVYDFGQDGEFPYYKFSNKVGVLELKVMKSEVMNKYKSGIPETYKEQHMTYIGILELDWGEIFVLKDGVVPVIFPYEFVQEKFDSILKQVNEFSYKVLSVKKIIHQGASITDIEQAVHEYEPEVKGTPAWYDFLVEHHRPDMLKPEIDGPKEILDLILKYQAFKEQTLPLENQMSDLRNKIMKFMVDRQVMTLKFGVLGQLKWHLKFNLDQSAKKIYANYLLQKS